MTLFSGKKFYVPSSIARSEELRTMLISNGAQLIEADTEENVDDNVICVVDSFGSGNVLFDDLWARGCHSIVSSQCIFETVQMNKPFLKDQQFPLFSRAMEGVVVSLCNSTNEKQHVELLLKYMGAKVTEAVDDTTQYVLANKAAMNKIIPIVRPSWVKDVWQEQKLISHIPYVLPAFYGCIISITGLSASTRSEISRLTKAFGGEYTPNLTKRCTHLLARFPQGIKYRYALEWGIHCVSVDWFFDSINRQGCIEESQYFLAMSEASKKALFSPMTAELNRLSPALRRKHLQSQVPTKRNSSSSRRNSYSSPSTTSDFSYSASLMNGFEHFHERHRGDTLKYVSSSPMLGFMTSESFTFRPEYQREEEPEMDIESDADATHDSLSALLKKCDETIAFYENQKLDSQSTKVLEDALFQIGFSLEARAAPIYNAPTIGSAPIHLVKRRCSIDEVGEDESIDPMDSYDAEADDSDLEFSMRGRHDPDAQESDEGTSNMRRHVSQPKPIPANARTGRKEGEAKM